VTRVVERFASPRLAAGALFVDGDRVLLVHKTYGNGWDIPGGCVDRGESPAMEILYVFHCGDLEPDASHIHLRGRSSSSTRT
jgi:8-oxo-dGTP pyrophosphatase MutT (NUDIX family)